MRESFGELILKKDSILYHITNDNYDKIIKNQKNINSFLDNIYLHPSQFNGSIKLFKITLKKDIFLFCDFEVEYWNNNFRIVDLFKKLPNGNQLFRLLNIKLKQNNFDGFISPQYNNAKNFEITLFNDNDIFDIEKLENIENWNNKDIVNACGNYPFCFTYIKPIFNLNRCYEKIINSCIEYYKSNTELKPKSNGFFYLLFIYSDINYHDYENKNIFDILLNNI